MDSWFNVGYSLCEFININQMITIFTPTYNRAHLLERLYKSLCHQSNKDFEWVIVDDGSVDHTEKLIESFQLENQIPIQFFKQENSGKHTAINKGVAMAKGELFFIVDSDDFLPLCDTAVGANDEGWLHFPSLAEKLSKYGVKILGTSFDALDLAEDRGRFSDLLTELNIPFPKFGIAETADEASALADTLDFPLLIRPSYVLGGQGMKIVINKQELEEHVINLLKSIPGNKLLLDHYLDGAIEAEADAICDADGNVYIIGIMEHIEPCGVHSGDSNATLPPFNLGEFVMQQIKDHTHKIAVALKTVGLINIQFAIKNDIVYIIEANPRASRTVPFIAKAYGEPYVNYATKVMLGANKVTDFKYNPQLKGYAIKQPVFSFSKFQNVNKALGPEMKSTGESILFIDDLKDDQFYELYSRRKMYLSK